MSIINFYRDKPDLIVKLTEDDIINVTGSVGSGKSTYGRKYRSDKNYIVIGFDSISSDNDPDTLNDDVIELRKILLKKHKTLKMDESFYYDDIVNYIKTKNKKGIIEGGHLMHISDIAKFRGTIIVKRTARFKCYYRSAYRDYKNPVWRVGLSRFGLFKRFIHCFKRRFHHVFHQHHVEDFILKLESYNNGNITN